jgi:hypothetical protein
LQVGQAEPGGHLPPERHREAAPGGGRGDDLHARAARQCRGQQRLGAADPLMRHARHLLR